MTTEQNNPGGNEGKGIRGFFGTRMGYQELGEKILLEPIKGGSRWSAAFGSLLLFAFVLQVVTGILMTMNYAPSVATAWHSVKYIQEEVPLGWLVRGMHHWGSSAMVILLLVHLVQVFVWGAYKRPRELTWMVGVMLLLTTLGLSFTGYLLPWDEKAYWASKVGLGIMSTAPVLGDAMRVLMQGGPDMGNLTLTRFFTLHAFILPAALAGLAMVHLYLFRRHGVTTSWWKGESELLKEQEPFWPGQVWKDGVFALGLLLVLGWWTWTHAAPLSEEADPSRAYAARPEWYFMFLFETLKYFKGPYELLGTMVLPTVFLGVLFFWPFLDRTEARDPRKRPVAMALLALGTVGLVGLTIFAIATDVRMEEPAASKKEPVKQPAGLLQRLDIENVYATKCQNCHLVDGTGSQLRAAGLTIPDFTDAAWHKTQTDDVFVKQIVEGKGIMPGFGKELNSDQVQGLMIYMRLFATKPLPTATTAASTKVAATTTAPATTR